MKKLLIIVAIFVAFFLGIVAIKQTSPNFELSNTQLVQTVYARGNNGAGYTNALNPALKTAINKSMGKFVKNLELKYPDRDKRFAYIKKLKKILTLVSKKKYGMVKYIMEYIVSIL